MTRQEDPDVYQLPTHADPLFCHEPDQLIGEPIDTLVREPLWQIYAEHR